MAIASFDRQREVLLNWSTMMVELLSWLLLEAEIPSPRPTTPAESLLGKSSPKLAGMGLRNDDVPKRTIVTQYGRCP